MRVALVTGAGSGLGAAIAAELAACGHHVVCTGRRIERVRAVAEQIVERGGAASALPLDVTDSGAVDATLVRIRDELGRLDLLVNNAGLFRRGEVVTLGDAEWELTLATNLTGAFFCARAAARIMSAQQPLDESRGHIVNINSGAGLHGYPTGSAYTASKFGLLGLSDTLRSELAASSIKVTDVVVATSVESELSSRAGVQRLPAATVGRLVRDAVLLPGRAVVTRVDLGQLTGE